MPPSVPPRPSTCRHADRSPRSSAASASPQRADPSHGPLLVGVSFLGPAEPLRFSANRGDPAAAGPPSVHGAEAGTPRSRSKAGSPGVTRSRPRWPPPSAPPARPRTGADRRPGFRAVPPQRHSAPALPRVSGAITCFRWRRLVSGPRSSSSGRYASVEAVSGRTTEPGADASRVQAALGPRSAGRPGPGPLKPASQPIPAAGTSIAFRGGEADTRRCDHESTSTQRRARGDLDHAGHRYERL